MYDLKVIVLSFHSSIDFSFKKGRCLHLHLVFK